MSKPAKLISAALLVVFAFAVYLPSFSNGFIWDDPEYVTENPLLRNADGLRRIWFEPSATPQYYPLVHTVFWLEYQLWGNSPFGYHFNNIGLHALNAVLVYSILRRWKIRGAWIAAAIFVIHPVHVESVAWVTERKNLLSSVFYLAALILYFRFLSNRESGIAFRSCWKEHVMAFLLFLCALFSKTVTCSLPAAILLLLWWKRGKIERREIIPLIPFFAAGAVSGLSTAWLERHYAGAQGPEWMLSGIDRCLVAGRALWFYASKLLWPQKLIFIYPRWHIDAHSVWPYIFPAAALLLLFGFWLSRNRLGRAPLTSMLFFAGTLLPALGFINFYPMRFSFVADHFQYLASLGLIVPFGWALSQIPSKQLVRFLSGALLAALGLLTWKQQSMYRDMETLWSSTLRDNPNCWMAHNNLGLCLVQRGRISEGMEHYAEAIRMKPDAADAHNNLGSALESHGQIDRAILEFQEALRLNPLYAEARYNLGVALDHQGRLEAAMMQYQDALRIKPDYAAAHNNLASVLNRKKQMKAAIQHCNEAIRLQPNLVEAYLNLGNAFALEGKLEQAVAIYRRALQIQPNHSEIWHNLSVVLKSMGRIPEAMEAHRRASAIEAKQSDQDPAN